MTKQEPPITKDTTKKLADISVEDMTSKLAEIQEALLNNPTFKDIDQYKALGLTKPEDKPKEKENKKQINQEAIDRLLPILDKTRVELTEAGYEFPTVSKMSEGEKALHEKLEVIAVAKFAEQKSDILKIDPDYPVKEIEDLKIPTESKIAVMNASKEIAERNVEAVKKVKSELDTTVTELKEVKLSSPKEEETDSTGESKVNEQLAKFGMKVEVEENTGNKSEKNKKE